MTYSTQDGNTVQVRDLSSAPKAQGDCMPTASPTKPVDKSAPTMKKQCTHTLSHIKDRDIVKALQMTNKYMRKSQTDFPKVTPQSKLRYQEPTDLSVGAHNLIKNI